MDSNDKVLNPVENNSLRKINNKRLLLEVPEEIHKEVKSRAIFINISMRKWILQAILEKMAKEDQYR